MSGIRPVLSVTMLVTKSGAPLVMEVAVPKVPGGLILGVAISVAVGTKLKVVLMGTADAVPITANDAPRNKQGRSKEFHVCSPLRGVHHHARAKN